MKKQYFSPTTEVVTIGIQPSLLAGSLDAEALGSDQVIDISTPGEEFNEEFSARELDW